ncbi:FAD:protein FMN transferase [Ferrimonas gelatinilytica]|uniref:FAD:protein FMN transferase n=1 Tax=Ferrimonas gelatinilytica TaxID=1255257 RepID=A0ABP9RUI6_9GAMM
MTSLTRHPDYWRGHFIAMASDCELLIDPCPESRARALLVAAERRVRAIEQKYSRYREDNLVARLHRAEGKPVAIDGETLSLLTFADHCYRLSDGLFDLTSGVLRRAWRFDGCDRLPSQGEIDALLPLIGWERVRYDDSTLSLPAGMELDFGGIGKEYAVDQVAAELARQAPSLSVLVNFGGDIAISVPRAPERPPWQVGIATPSKPTQASYPLTLRHGALATSGDSQRFLRHGGVRYSHILNPKTGWATRSGPAQVTVAGQSCLQAGLLATLALLHETEAEAFIRAQQVPYWIQP